jgi:EmrB/QacA subfamily drug resistance transporter
MSSTAPRIPRDRRLILIAMCVALASVVSAVSSLNVALPELATATGASPTQQQWIIDAYALVFAGLLLPAGAIGDYLGRRRVLLSGLALFAGAALVAMAVTSPGGLIAVRAVMGIAAALIMPATLASITSAFGPGYRDKAVAVWAGVAGGSALIGLLVAGTLLELFDWTSAFGLNVVMASVALVLTARFVPAAARNATKLDVPGAALSALGLGGIVWAFIEGPSRGWTDGLVVTGFAAGVLLLITFVVHELRTREPLLDPRLFAVRTFSAGALSVFVQFFALFGVIFVLLQYVQLVLGYSPLEAGAALAPAAVMMMAIAPRAPRLAARLGLRRLSPLGLVCIAAGLLVASTMGADASYLHLLGALVLLGLGMALAGPPATTAIVESLPAEKQGVASAVNDAAREVGGALGIAVLGSVLADHLTAGPDGMVDGYQAALRIGAAVLVTGAVAVALRARQPRQTLNRTASSGIRVLP